MKSEVAVEVAASEHDRLTVEVTYKAPIARPKHAMRSREPGVGLVVFGIRLVVSAVALMGAEYLACVGHSEPASPSRRHEHDLDCHLASAGS